MGALYEFPSSKIVLYDLIRRWTYIFTLQPRAANREDFNSNFTNNDISADKTTMIKLLTTKMVSHIQHSPQYSTIQKLDPIYNNICSNDEVDKLAKQGSLVDHIPSHWLLHPLVAASVPTSMQHDGSFRYLKHYTKKLFCNLQLRAMVVNTHTHTQDNHATKLTKRAVYYSHTMNSYMYKMPHKRIFVDYLAPPPP